jgi:peptidyl-tRNA hydrolase, PTH1 family
MGIQLIVGLGNPGSEYEATRHNVGRWLVEKLAADKNLQFQTEPKFKSLIATIEIANKKCWLLLPSTYMNLSGEAVLKFVHFHKILPEYILVVHDELDLSPGVIRLKKDGGHGGHNGLRSIITQLGSKEFYRLRIGIGHPGDKDLVSGYVLSKPNQSDRELIWQAIDRGLDAVPEIINENFDLANRLLAE